GRLIRGIPILRKSPGGCEQNAALATLFLVKPLHRLDRCSHPDSLVGAKRQITAMMWDTYDVPTQSILVLMPFGHVDHVGQYIVIRIIEKKQSSVTTALRKSCLEN